MSSLSIVVPAYNESERLKVTLPKFIKFAQTRQDLEIIIINDGSSDQTSNIVKSFDGPLKLIELDKNCGKGAAVKAGMLEAGKELVLMTDCDLSTPLEDVLLLEEVISGGADIAIGSRALNSDVTEVKAKPYRKFIGRVFAFFVNTVTGLPFSDTQCGFKLFRNHAAKEIFNELESNHFAFDVEVLLLAKKKGFSVQEVPVNWQHVSGSKVNLLTDSLKMAIDILKIRLRLCV